MFITRVVSRISKPELVTHCTAVRTLHIRQFCYLVQLPVTGAIDFTTHKQPCVKRIRAQLLTFPSLSFIHTSVNLERVKKCECHTFNLSICQATDRTRYSTSSTLLANQKQKQQDSPIPDMSKDGESTNKNITKENILTIPNVLTLSRAVLSPVLGYLVVTGSYPWALGIFIYAGITDYLDGAIARRWPSQRTVCGTIVDPVADKLLVMILAASLSYASLLPTPLAAIIILKDVGLVIGGFIVRYISLEKPVTLMKFFDFKLPSVEMKPLEISKWTTLLQISTLATSLAAPIFGFIGHPVLPVLWYSTGILTAVTGLSYAAARGSYELKDAEKKK